MTMPAHSVLVAEDGAAFRADILAMLEPLGLACIPAVNGREAIDVIEDPSQDLHLLITDLEMPERNGWDVIRAFRERRGDSLPVIMQTGQAQVGYVWTRARELDVVLIDKLDLPRRLVPEVRAALGVAPA